MKDKTDLDLVKKKINERMAENPIGSTELIRLTKGEQVEMQKIVGQYRNIAYDAAARWRFLDLAL